MDFLQMKARIGHPEEWASLDENSLHALAAVSAVYYGVTAEAELLPRLESFQAALCARATAASRRRLLLLLVRLVRERVTTPLALLPFLRADDDLALVRDAALAAAVLMPLRDGDPLTGPSLVAHWAASLDDEARRGAVYAAVLRLGDRRAIRLIKGCWRTLGVDGREQLRLVADGSHVAGVIDFLLDWLSDDTTDAQAGAIAGALADLPRTARIVFDYERVFPATAAGSAGEELLVRALWSVEAYARHVRARLGETARCVPEESARHALVEFVRRAWEPVDPGRAA